jgi:hypothetical protein
MSELIDNQAVRIQTLKEVILHLQRGEAAPAPMFFQDEDRRRE